MEAAFALPVVLLLVLLLVQPGILLYDRIVMQGAAAEACRLLSTTDAADASEVCESFIRRRLGAIPQQDCFHVHEGGCTWSISLEGSQSSESVRVRLSTRVRPLPLLGAGAKALGALRDDGTFAVEVETEMPTQPAWVARSENGVSPSEWIGAWARESVG